MKALFLFIQGDKSPQDENRYLSLEVNEFQRWIQRSNNGNNSFSHFTFPCPARPIFRKNPFVSTLIYSYHIEGVCSYFVLYLGSIV